jgi:hypothetical protein
MWIRTALSSALLVGLALPCLAQEEAAPKPLELLVLQGYVGVWDAEVEVWAAGLDAPPIQFTGVETNRPYGEHWIASDFDSEYLGQSNKVHSIVGYDLEQQRLVGTVIDAGPYAATMTGDYDPASKTVHWVTEARDPNGSPMTQKTAVTQKSADERVLVLSMPGQDGAFVKFMQIRYVKRN